jgi:hypothetical protein
MTARWLARVCSILVLARTHSATASPEDDAHAQGDSKPRRTRTVVYTDLRAGYPIPLTKGPGAHRYLGRGVVGGRVGLVGETLGMTLGVDVYYLRSEVALPASPDKPVNISADMLSWPLALLYRPLTFADTGWHELCLETSVAAVGRGFESTDGRALSGLFALRASWNLLLGGGKYRSEGFFWGPDVELAYVTEAEDSTIGSLPLLSLGARVGYVP